MGSLKIYLPDEVESAFRRKAMESFGYGRGSISKAAQAAIVGWMSGPPSTGEDPVGKGRPDAIGKKRMEGGDGGGGGGGQSE